MEFKIEKYNKLTSTNLVAKERIKEGCSEGLVIVSSEQTEGRGRLGRTWHSPGGKGIYLSIVIKPTLNVKWLAPITLLTAVAVSESIRQSFGFDAKIKWPNDLLTDNKKICGVLLESVVVKNQVNIIVGIGVNINHMREDFDKTIQDIATSVRIVNGTPVPNVLKENFIDNLLANFNKEYIDYLEETTKKDSMKNLVKKWSDKSCTIGRTVSFNREGKVCIGTAIKLDENGQLVLKLKNNEIVEINSGEINILE